MPSPLTAWRGRDVSGRPRPSVPDGVAPGNAGPARRTTITPPLGWTPWPGPARRRDLRPRVSCTGPGSTDRTVTTPPPLSHVTTHRLTSGIHTRGPGCPEMGG